MSSENQKVCILVANPYYGKEYELGDAVMNDCFLLAQMYKNKDYKLYLLTDYNKEDFVKIIQSFSDCNLNDFVLFYSGHGISLDDSSGSEEDGKDEAFVFVDGFIKDDEIKSLIQDVKSKNKLVLSDCCHSGTILDYAKGCCSFSACMDSQCALQTTENGLFTKYLVDNFEKDLSEIEKEFNKNIYQQKSILSNEVKRLKLFI